MSRQSSIQYPATSIPSSNRGPIENQKNFSSIFTTHTDMQEAQLLIKTVSLDKSVLRIILSEVMKAHAISKILI
jgi:hypothetical protein